MAITPFIIPIFLPQAGCPHQCVFCNQRAITGVRKAYPTLSALAENITTFLTYNHRHNPDIQLSFYGGNFLGLSDTYLIQLLDLAQSFVDKKQINSIRFSTRPDTVTEKQLQLIKNYTIKTVELGVQSMDDKVLQCSQRGHTSAVSRKATALLKSSGYTIGHQLMPGLPGENDQSFIQTVKHVIDMHPDFVRLYPTVVLKGSLLANWYKSGRYHPMTLENAVTIVKNSVILFQENGIKVIRLGLHSQEHLKANIVAGPFHPSFGHMVYSEQMLDRMSQQIKASHSDTISILANPKDMSLLTGIHKKNIAKLKTSFPEKRIKIISDPGIEKICIIEHRLFINS